MLLGVYKEGVCTLQDADRIIKPIWAIKIDSIPVFMPVLTRELIERIKPAVARTRFSI